MYCWRLRYLHTVCRHCCCRSLFYFLFSISFRYYRPLTLCAHTDDMRYATARSEWRCCLLGDASWPHLDAFALHFEDFIFWVASAFERAFSDIRFTLHFHFLFAVKPLSALLKMLTMLIDIFAAAAARSPRNIGLATMTVLQGTFIESFELSVRAYYGAFSLRLQQIATFTTI